MSIDKNELLSIPPMEIEKRSMEIIKSELGEHDFSSYELPILLRCIHTSADFDYRDNIRFSPKAVEEAIKIIKESCTIVTDTQMGSSGINKKILQKFGCEIRCFMSDPDVIEEAKQRGVTRAIVSMEKASEITGNLIIAIGNAPTALIRMCQLIEEGKCKPNLLIGVPVGFVNVVESKNILLETECSYITALGRKGGSNIVASICNAILYMASNDERE